MKFVVEYMRSNRWKATVEAPSRAAIATALDDPVNDPYDIHEQLEAGETEIDGGGVQDYDIQVVP